MGVKLQWKWVHPAAKSGFLVVKTLSMWFEPSLVKYSTRPNISGGDKGAMGTGLPRIQIGVFSCKNAPYVVRTQLGRIFYIILSAKLTKNSEFQGAPCGDIIFFKATAPLRFRFRQIGYISVFVPPKVSSFFAALLNCRHVPSKF